MNIRLVIIAVIPVAIILLGIYLSDRRDREPIKVLLFTYILGALTVIPAIVIEEVLIFFNVFPGILGAFFNAFIVAGFTEEYLKRKAVLLYPYKTRCFNEKLDGIVYSVFATMGFATVENIIYVAFRYTNNPFIGLYRGIFSVPAHAVFGITMGYYLSLAKFDTNLERKKINMRKSLYMPMLMHGMFDFILMAEMPQLTLLFVPYSIFLWILNQRRLASFMYDSRNRVIDIRRKQ